MERKYPHLCSPLRLGRVTLRNRMCAAPVGATDITADCGLGARSQAFYELRAKGGAAAVTASEVIVHPTTDGSHMLHLEMDTPGRLAEFTFLADAIRRHGAVPSLELSHAGQYAGTYLLDKNGEQCMHGPSGGVRHDGVPVRGLTKAEIADIVRAFGETAALAKRAGFEMLLIHGAHGWLINQFLSPYFNHREDEYGGCLENRLRFAREVLQSVRDAVGEGFPIEFRMSGAELFEGGYGLAEGVRIAQGLEDLVDMFHVSAGSYQFGFFNTHPSMFDAHGCNVYLAAEIKKNVKVPVATVGALNDPAQMEEIIASGKADVIEMARALLADPFLPNKVMAERPEEIVHCLRCYACMAERAVTQTRRCAVNPLIGREIEGTEVLPARKKKKVLVAGGGVAGMEAALIAAQRGHAVTLCEATDTLGGILVEEQAIPFKYEMYKLGLTLETLLQKEGVDIRLNTRVTKAFAEEFAPDALIIAVGSTPIDLPLPGKDSSRVILVNDYYRRASELTDKVVVMGGGLAGCELAIHLGQQGKEVHIVEMRPELAVDCNIRQRPILLRTLERYATVHTGCAGKCITPEGLVCETAAGEKLLVPGTSIVFAVGQRANASAADELRDCAPFVRTVGDCVRPANILRAMYEAYHAALDI